MVFQPSILDSNGAAMTSMMALRQGVRMLNHTRRLILVFYIATTVSALLVSGAAMTVVFHGLGHSAWAERMLTNFDVQWVAELVAADGMFPGLPVAAVLLATFCISALVYLFFLGGALEIFCNQLQFSMHDFFGGCGKHFGRLLRLAASAFVCCVLLILVGSLLSFAGRKMWGNGSEATPLVYWRWFEAAVMLAGFGLVDMVFGYAVIHLARGDSRKALSALRAAAGLVAHNPRRTAGLYILLWMVVVLLFGAYLAVSQLIHPTAFTLIIALLLLRQAMVGAKIWSRLLFYASQFGIYRSLKPPLTSTLQTEAATLNAGGMSSPDGAIQQIPESCS
jgi:hypothetical protein